MSSGSGSLFQLLRGEEGQRRGGTLRVLSGHKDITVREGESQSDVSSVPSSIDFFIVHFPRTGTEHTSVSRLEPGV